MCTETPGAARRQHRGRASARARKGSKLKPAEGHRFLQMVVGEDVHAKRVLSLVDGVVSVLQAATLGIHAIGRELAAARNLEPRHAIKQVDRLLSNSGLSMSMLLAAWVRFVVGPREELVVALDWTDFAADDQAVVELYLVTSHGRATPLVRKSQLKDNRANHEFELVLTLHDVLPEHASLTLVADRGFGTSGSASTLTRWAEFRDPLSGLHQCHARRREETRDAVAPRQRSGAAPRWRARHR